MLLLAIETSGKHGTIALVRGGPNGNCSITATSELHGGTFSAQLIPEIAALLSNNGLTKHDIELFVVGSGPGSFTGLRVGLAAVKGLADALEKPIVPVSLLAAIAAETHNERMISTALDAGRQQIYLGGFEVSSTGLQTLSERLLNREEFLAAIPDRNLLTPDALIAEFARTAGALVQVVDYPNAAAVARTGWKKFLTGDFVSAEGLEANYIRRSDPELSLKRTG